MSEAQYQKRLVKKLERMFPGIVVLKNDSQYRQGMLDWLLLYDDMWAMLEVKNSLASPYQPNQEYYIRQFGEMSFAQMICPENEEEVLLALQETFASRRAACLPQS